MTISDVKSHLTGMLHAGSSLEKVRNLYYALERAATNVNANIKPVDSERETSLTSLVYDDVYNYPLPSDFGTFIDLIPQGNRSSHDAGRRQFSQPFDLQKALKNKTLSIEGREGTKILRTNWRGQSPIQVDGMNVTTGWSVVASASGLRLQEIRKIAGSGSIEVDISATGDGIQKTTLDTINLTDEDEIADHFVWVYLSNSTAVSRLTSITAIWGNDLTTAYWTGVAQTAQADGTAFKVGWNLIKWPWSTATETGTVAPATIDSIKYTFTVTAAIANVAIDEPVFVVGRAFDFKYYSAYGFKNSAGTYIIRPTIDSDDVIYSGTALECFLEECRKECAAQIEGEDSTFDISFAEKRLYGNPNSPDPISRVGLYAKYRSEYPSNAVKATRNWANPRNPNLK